MNRPSLDHKRDSKRDTSEFILPGSGDKSEGKSTSEFRVSDTVKPQMTGFDALLTNRENFNQTVDSEFVLPQNLEAPTPTLPPNL